MSWSILGLKAPVSESSTLYVLTGTTLLNSQVQIHGTGLTYDPVTGFLNGGTITSADLVANGEIVQTITMNGGLPGATFANFWAPAKAIASQVANWGVDASQPTSVTTTAVTIYLPDGTQVKLDGTGFSGYSNLGTVTAVKHLAADGVTVIGTVTGLPQPLGIVSAALGGDKGFYHYLDQGNNTVTQVSTTQFIEIDGGAGTNTIVGSSNASVYLPVTFLQATSSVTIDLAAQTAIGGGVNDTLVNIHSVTASTFGDTIRGDASNDFLFGGVGNDIITGGSGNDLISGGSGRNTIDGGSGINTIDYSWTNAGVHIDFGAATNQAYSLNTSIDTFVDQLKNIQIVIGSNGDDVFIGSAGNFRFDAGLGNNIVSYVNTTSGITAVITGGSGIVVKGASMSGTDTVSGITKVIGGSGNDVFTVGSGVGIDGAGGFNTEVLTSTNQNVVLGDIDHLHIQQLVLGGGTNFASVAATDIDFSYLYGGAGINTLTLGAGGGYLFSTGGTNHMFGGTAAAATDVFVGGIGASDMHGGAGANVFYAGASDTVTGGAGYNTLVELSTGVTLKLGTSHINQVILNGGTNSVDMTGSTDFVYLYGGIGTNTLKLGAAGGYEFSTGGTNHMYGGTSGTSVFVGGVGASDMHGNGGNNVYYVGANDTVFGATATGSYNTLVELAQGVTLTLGSAGLTNVQQFILNGGTNTLNGSAATSQLIIYGGAGNDTLKGGAGNDYLYGEGGTNTFQFGPNWGNDTIGDWASGTNNIIDLTALSSSGVHSLANVTQTISGGNDTIVFGANTITLNGISAALTAASFHFA